MYNQANIKKWSTDYNIIQNPPPINALQSGQAAYINNKFNARNYIEEYFGDLTYKGNFNDNHKRTNWENDRISSNGIVMSYIWGTPSRRGGGGKGIIQNREGRQYTCYGGGERLLGDDGAFGGDGDNADRWVTNGSGTQSQRNPIHFIKFIMQDEKVCSSI